MVPLIPLTWIYLMSRFTRCSLLLFVYFFSFSLAQANDTDESVVENFNNQSVKSFNTATSISVEKLKSRYIVSTGETLTDIALNLLKKTNLKISSSVIMRTAYKIASYNGIINPDFIITGQIIDLSIMDQSDASYAMQNELPVPEISKTIIQQKKSKPAPITFDIVNNVDNFDSFKAEQSSKNPNTDGYDELNSINLVKEESSKKNTILLFGSVAQLKINPPLKRFSRFKRFKKRQDDLIFSKKNEADYIKGLAFNTPLKRFSHFKRFKKRQEDLIFSKKNETDYIKGLANKEKTVVLEKKENLVVDNKKQQVIPGITNSIEAKRLEEEFIDSPSEVQIASESRNLASLQNEIVQKQTITALKNNLEIKNTLAHENYFKSKEKFFNTAKVSDTKKELDVLVKDLIEKADKPDQLPKFKKFKEIITIPFGSTPLFLQTLESLKIAEEKKNLAFSKFLPKVTSSVGGGIKSGGFNNDTSSQSKNLSISQLVYDFGVTRRQYQVTEKEELSSQYKIDQQRTDLLFELISAFYEVYRAETLLKLSQGFVQTRREFLESVKTRQKLGGSSNADVIRAETKLSEALDKIPTEVQNLKNSKAVFNEYFDINLSIKTQLHQVPNIENVIFELSNENIDKNFKIAEIANQIKAAELNYEAEKRSRFGKFGLQAGYQNTDTNLNTPQEQSSILLTYQIDVFSGFESKAKISQANLKVNALKYEMDRMRKELLREMNQSENSYEAQSALVLSRVALVKGAELSNQVNRELFELNKTSINDLFRSQEEFLTSAKNLVDATVEKNLSFYRLAAKFGTLLNLFELRT